MSKKTKTTSNGKTAIKFLIDRSGSMAGMAQEAVGGMKNLIEDQRKIDGECTLSVSQFDDQYDLVYGSTDIHKVPEPKLSPRGMTALYDGWGRALEEFQAEIKAMPKEERPEHIIFVVITDGGENASREWTRDKVFKRVTKLTEKGWTFLYLGANQDAMSVGVSLGVAAGNSLTYAPTAAGNQQAYNTTSSVLRGVRTGVGPTTLMDAGDKK